jgi:hypothetical protein
MFRRLALGAILAAGLTTTFAADANQPTPEMHALNPPFAVYLFSSAGFEFCDYFLITKNGLLAGGTHNQSTFCEPPFPDGLVSGNFNLSWGVVPFSSTPDHAYNLNSTVAFPLGLFYLFDNQKRVWANYGWDGTTLVQINAGPFTIGAPPMAGAIKGKRPSTQKQQ